MNAFGKSVSKKTRPKREKNKCKKKRAREREREREARRYTTRAHPLYARVQVQTHLLFPTTKSVFFCRRRRRRVSIMCREREREREKDEVGKGENFPAAAPLKVFFF